MAGQVGLLGGQEHADVARRRVEGPDDRDHEHGEEGAHRGEADPRGEHQHARPEQQGPDSGAVPDQAHGDGESRGAQQGAGDDRADLERGEPERAEIADEQHAHEAVGEAAEPPSGDDPPDL